MIAIVLLSIHMLKYPNLWMFQTAAKSLQNIEICDFCLKLEKSRHVQTGCFLSKFYFYSNRCQISKYPNLQHTFSIIRLPNLTILRLTSYFPGHLRKSEIQNANCTKSLVKLSPKYPSSHWKWEFGTIRIKNNRWLP